MYYYERIPSPPIPAIEVNLENWGEICEFLEEDENSFKGIYLDNKTKKPLPDDCSSNTMGVYLTTPNGKVLAVQGDYIMKDVNGHPYPCSRDVFLKTYKRLVLPIIQPDYFQVRKEDPQE